VTGLSHRLLGKNAHLDRIGNKPQIQSDRLAELAFDSVSRRGRSKILPDKHSISEAVAVVPDTNNMFPAQPPARTEQTIDLGPPA
jgi:hypothetical protein